MSRACATERCMFRWVRISNSGPRHDAPACRDSACCIRTPDLTVHLPNPGGKRLRDQGAQGHTKAPVTEHAHEVLPAHLTCVRLLILLRLGEGRLALLGRFRDLDSFKVRHRSVWLLAGSCTSHFLRSAPVRSSPSRRSSPCPFFTGCRRDIAPKRASPEERAGENIPKGGNNEEK